MTSPIKWKVSPPPTGRYRSFYRRGWPSAEHKETGRMLFMISCEDEYTNGKPPHAPLKLRVAIKNEHNSWDLRTIKQRFDTLHELKEYANKLYHAKKEWFE